MPLPTTPTKKSRTMPRTMILMGKAKRGKSTILADLTMSFAPGKALIISVGEFGYEDQDAVYVQCNTAKKFNEILDEIEAANKAEKSGYKYDFLITDHLSKLDEWAEILGTLNYMGTTQGKNFNAKNPNLPANPGYSSGNAQFYHMPGSSQFKSVYTLPNGAGYRWGRSVAYDWLYKLETLAKYVIIVGHIKVDRYTKEDTGNQVNSAFLYATGQIASKYIQHVDAVAMFSRKKDEGFLSFKRANADYDAGSRYSYLEDQKFKISERDETTGEIITYWENIYPDYTA